MLYLSKASVYILINQVRHLSRINIDRIPTTLPMRREDDHRTWLDLSRDLASDLGEFLVGWVFDIVHDVGLFGTLD